MEIVDNSVRCQAGGSRTVRYKMWKQSLHKWDQFVKNRHAATKLIDTWSNKILQEANGATVVFNSGGMFFKDFNTEITVVEVDPAPILIPGIKYLGDARVKLVDSVDSLIMVNPISIKYHSSLVTFLMVPGESRAGNKPNLLSWVRKAGKIFLSFSDFHMSYNRLKFTKEEFILGEIDKLKQVGLRCDYVEIKPSQFDVVNGNIKLIFKKENNHGN